MVRYFKKFDTRITVHTGAGSIVPFEAIVDENGRPYEWGVLQTSDGYLISELEKLIQRQVGGVMEIGQAEYEALKKKEQQKLLPSWRETVWPRKAYRQLLEDVRALVAVDRTGRPLPAVVKGLQAEFQTLARPLGALNNWRPQSIAR